MNTPRQRILFVHAHPDDETISTGGTIATLIDEGVLVTVVTCTRGELGEVIPRELQHLEREALADYRAGELAAAMAILGVNDHRFLGDANARAAGAAPRRYLDSGMQWGPAGAEALPNANPASLCAADPLEVVGDLAAVAMEIRPNLIVSYDENGGYGHPDHVRAHDIAFHVALLMGVPFSSIVPPGSGLPTDRVIDISAARDRKLDALGAYRTQLTVTGDSIVHSGGQVEDVGSIETFRSLGSDSEPGFVWSELKPASRIIANVLSSIAGVVIAAIGTVNHSIGLAIPALLIVATLLAGTRAFFGVRAPTVAAALGVLVTVGTFSLTGPGGSILILADVSGLVWTIGSAALCAIAVVWPQSWGLTRDTMKGTTRRRKGVEVL